MPNNTNKQLHYLAITDFSPGIKADTRVSTIFGSGVEPNATGQPGEALYTQTIPGFGPAYTQGCYANSEGRLIPLPGAQALANPIPMGTDTFVDSAGIIATLANNIPNEDVWVWVHVVNNTPKDCMRVYRCPVSLVAPTLIKSHIGAGATAGPGRGITRFLSRGQRANFSTPGGPELFWEWTSGEPHTDGSTMFYDVFPDPNATNVDTPDFEETGVINNAAFLLGGQIVPHNGRILRFCEQNHNFGTRKFYSNERVRNTDPPNAVSLTSTTTDSILDPQFPGTYGAWGSLTYGELLIVKQFGGA